MSKLRAQIGILVSLLMLSAALALLASGCSVRDASVGSTSTSGASTTVPAGSASTDAGSTGSSQTIKEGKTAEEYEAELPELQKAVDASLNDLTALLALAVAQYNANRYDDAAATYLKMLQIREDPVIRNNYANVLRDAGKIEEARVEYEKAIAGEPTLTVAHLNLAMMLKNGGYVTEANEVLDRGIAAVSGDDQTRLKKYKESLNSTTTTT